MESSVIYKKVQDYLVDYVGELTAPGAPVFDVTTRRWRVPVYCRVKVGEILVDEAGNLVAVPDKEQMEDQLRAQITGSKKRRVNRSKVECQDSDPPLSAGQPTQTSSTKQITSP